MILRIKANATNLKIMLLIYIKMFKLDRDNDLKGLNASVNNIH